jgi:hypothetical protein
MIVEPAARTTLPLLTSVTLTGVAVVFVVIVAVPDIPGFNS